MRTIEGIAHLFKPLEDAIAGNFLPAVIGRPISEIERKIFSLPVKYGGLGVRDPTKVADVEYYRSCKITEPLVKLIKDQVMPLENIVANVK